MPQSGTKCPILLHTTRVSLTTLAAPSLPHMGGPTTGWLSRGDGAGGCNSNGCDTPAVVFEVRVNGANTAFHFLDGADQVWVSVLLDGPFEDSRQCKPFSWTIEREII